jgi:hypothetical protein
MASQARSPSLKDSPSMIFKHDGSPKEEAASSVTMVKRNTY